MLVHYMKIFENENMHENAVIQDNTSNHDDQDDPAKTNRMVYRVAAQLKL